jgi:uncharacterized membrane protein
MVEAQREPTPPLERMMFFSDAVFAIAITLLVIEIEVPQLPHGASNSEHLAALANLTPHFIGYVISFAVIGVFWTGHHRAFSLALHFAPGLYLPNLALLGAIAFMPFSTAYLSENYSERVPHIVYNGMLLLTALLNVRVVRKVTGRPYVDENASAKSVAVVRAWSWGLAGGAVLAFAVSFIAPQWSHAALIMVPMCMVLAIGWAKRRVAVA